MLNLVRQLVHVMRSSTRSIGDWTSEPHGSCGYLKFGKLQFFGAQ